MTDGRTEQGDKVAHRCVAGEFGIREHNESFAIVGKGTEQGCGMDHGGKLGTARLQQIHDLALHCGRTHGQGEYLFVLGLPLPDGAHNGIVYFHAVQGMEVIVNEANNLPHAPIL